MPVDPNIDILKALADQIAADDAVEDAAYEATFHAALLNREKTGSSQLFLTLLGGGAFGNRMEWIIDAIRRTVELAKGSGLEFKIISYQSRTPELRELLDPDR